MTTPADLDAHEAWLASLPPPVADEARRLYPDPSVLPWCVRSTTNPGHYLVVSLFSALDADPPVTVKVDHAADSYLPGVRVFDVPAAELVPCGCGRGALPSAVQATATSDQLAAKLAEAKAAAAAAGLDWDALAPAERRMILWGQP